MASPREAEVATGLVEDRNYRLSHCRGFAVFDPGGRIGVVEELVHGSRRDRPDFLVVRRGLIRRRRLRIPIEQVVEIDLERRRVLVHGAPVGRLRWPSPAAEIEETELPLAPIRGDEPT